MAASLGRFITLRLIAIEMAAIEVGIHAVLAPRHLQETAYIGVPAQDASPVAVVRC